MGTPLSVRRVLELAARPRVLRFAAVGFSGVFINLGVLYVLADVRRLNENISSAIAIELSILWNFVLNNAWTFRDKNEQARVGLPARLFRYNLVSLVGLAIQLGTFMLLNQLTMRALSLTEPGLWKYPSQLIGIGIAMGWNLATNFFWTWAQAEAPSRTAK